MTPSGPTYLVVVPTYRRPASACRLLDALVEQVASVPSAAVLLVDNDPRGSASGLADHPVLRGDGGGYLHEPTPGLATVRNAGLRAAGAAGAGFVVFVDDDEVPATGWLDALVRTQRDHRADVVAGPVRQLPEVRRTPAVRALLDREEYPQGVFTGDIGAGNVLVRMDFVHGAGLAFDTALDHAGGEDTLFFRQARRAGAVFAWAADAVAVEHNDPERLTPRALVLRRFRQGRAEHRIEARLGRHHHLPWRVVRVCAAGSWILLLLLTSLLLGRREEAWRQVFRLSFQAGWLCGAGGEASGPYGVSDAPPRPGAPPTGPQHERCER